MQIDPSTAGTIPEAPLPSGVTRDQHAGASTTLENCYAVQLFLKPPPGCFSLSYVIWRGPQSPKSVRIEPVTVKRIRDLRCGDWVEVDGQPMEVERSRFGGN